VDGRQFQLMVASITPGSLEYHCTEKIIKTLQNLALKFEKPVYKNHAQH
jgi:hypothetical protein